MAKISEWFTAKFIHRWQLRGQLLALAMLPVTFFACVWGGYVIQQRSSDLEAQLQQRAQLLSRQMAVAADYGIFSRNQAALQTLTLSVAKEPEVVAAVIYGANQETLATNAVGEFPTAIDTLQIAKLVRESSRQNNASVRQDVGQLIIYLEPVLSPALTIDDVPEGGAASNSAWVKGYALVCVTSEAIFSQSLQFGLAVFALLAAAMTSSWYLVKGISVRIDRRIQAMALAAQQIGSGVTGIRLGFSNVSVFNQLSQDINRMAERLETSRQHLELQVELATAGMREQRDNAERANSAKTRFLASASHDLRQPMHALSLLLAAMRQETSAPMREELLARIEATAEAMGNLLDALLDISRLDAGGVHAHPKGFALQPLLLTLRETYEGLAGRKNIELECRPTHLWAYSDPLLLQRMLGNFISNAIRYTPHGGRVFIAARRRGDQCLLQVRDNGPGIDELHQQSIFEEFVQIHNPQRDRSEGLGLGLAIVRRLAELLGHTLSLRSSAGSGATFSVTVPCTVPLSQDISDSGVNEGELPAVTPGGLQGCRILLCEDDHLVRESYERLLCLWGCEVKAYADASSLLLSISQNPWQAQLIISDYRLGGIHNGLQLIHAAHQVLGVEVPAVLITGDTEDPALRLVKAQEVRVLYKPVKPNLLLQTLLELLSSESLPTAVVD